MEAAEPVRSGDSLSFTASAGDKTPAYPVVSPPL